MNWTDKINQAKKMIDKYGASMRIMISTLSTYSATSDSYTASTTGYPIKGIFTDLIKKDDNGFVTKIKNGAILFSADTLPRLDDTVKMIITFGSKIYVSKQVDALQPGGQAILYKVRVV